MATNHEEDVDNTPVLPAEFLNIDYDEPTDENEQQQQVADNPIDVTQHNEMDPALRRSGRTRPGSRLDREGIWVSI